MERFVSLSVWVLSVIIDTFIILGREQRKHCSLANVCCLSAEMGVRFDVSPPQLQRPWNCFVSQPRTNFLLLCKRAMTELCEMRGKSNWFCQAFLFVTLECFSKYLHHPYFRRNFCLGIKNITLLKKLLNEIFTRLCVMYIPEFFYWFWGVSRGSWVL